MTATRRLLSLLIIAGVAAVAACHGDLSGPERARSELETNRAKWRAHGLRDYSLTMLRSCFCGDVGPFAVTVRDDSVVSAVRISDGAPSLVISYLPTVNKLFDFIQAAIDDKTKTITVTYDAELGFPREVNYDLAEQALDAGLYYTLTDVKPISANLQSR
jgi:hypothetical protein